MKTSIPKRIVVAVDHLAVQPHEHILEIGCGNGITADLICERLDDGRLVAIDRSETQVQLARRRNHVHIQSGKLILHTMALESVAMEEAQFDKIFAINVNCFWLRFEQPLAAVKRLLKPPGSFCICYQVPTTAGMRDIAATLRANLGAAGFTITRETTTEHIYCLASARNSTHG